jgi:mono/diheme cytochrome c family protein
VSLDSSPNPVGDVIVSFSLTGRNAPETKNPLPPNEANLTAGMEIFQSHCAVCHGDINHGSPLAESLYPRAPQFRRQKADMGETRPSI